ncbi:MAG: integron integrase, partial [Verrucomicrobiota bacterium]
ALRRCGLSYRTEGSYVGWYKRYVKFHGMRHPNKLGKIDVEKFLADLALNQHVSCSTQSQAMHSILFLYKEVMKQEIVGLDAPRAKKARKLPVVLSQDEIKRLLQAAQEGEPRVLIGLLYGCGLRVSEGLRLRVKDVDFENGLVWVRSGKGGKDRCLTLPKKMSDGLLRQRDRARLCFDEDEANGGSRVYVDAGLDRKHGGTLSKSWEWYWYFPARGRGIDPRDGVLKRHHLLEGAVSKWLRGAAKRAQIEKKFSAHALRHSYATHLLQKGTDLRTIQESLGHSSVKTTEVYTHVLHAMSGRASSPLDSL